MRPCCIVLLSVFMSHLENGKNYIDPDDMLNCSDCQQLCNQCERLTMIPLYSFINNLSEHQNLAATRTVEAPGFPQLSPSVKSRRAILQLPWALNKIGHNRWFLHAWNLIICAAVSRSLTRANVRLSSRSHNAGAKEQRRREIIYHIKTTYIMYRKQLCDTNFSKNCILTKHFKILGSLS
jgi:hypothetical protein